MQTLKSGPIAIAAVVVLAVVGSQFSPHQAVAQNPNPGSAPVHIVSPLPLPVTGSTTVSGTVAATQSGAWTVGIAGQPVLIKNLDEPGRAPYQETVFVGQACCGVGFSTTVFTFSVVPANKRLVIKDASLNLPAARGSAVSPAVLRIVGGGTPELNLPLILGGSLVYDEWITNQQVNFYVDQSQRPEILLSVDSAHAIAGLTATATLTGYYVSLP